MLILSSHVKLALLALPALLLVSVVTQAQTFILSDYVADVVGSHPQIKEQVHIFRQTRQDQVIAKSGWRPSVDLLINADKVNGESPDANGVSQDSDYNSNRTELSVTQNLFRGFDTRYGIKQTDARMRSALFQLYDTADNIALDAIQAYLEVLKQQRLLVLAKDNVASHEETLGKIRRRSVSGVGRRSQLEQTEGRVARAKAGFIAQQNNFQDTLTEAHQVLGRYLQAEQLVEPTLPESPVGDLDSLIDQALLQHPAIKVALNNIDAALYDQRRSRSKNYPSVDLRLAKVIGDDLNGISGDTDETRLTLSLAYNFYNGGADSAEQRQKISVVHEQQQFAARARRQVINTLRLAWMADESLKEQLKFLKQHVVQSQKTMQSYREEFFIGQRDLIDLLDAKNELNSAQSRYTEAYYDSLAARYRVFEGLGLLFQALQLEPELSEDNFKVARLTAQGDDSLPLNQDIDADKKVDNNDHCDNSLALVDVDQYGCLITAEKEFTDFALKPAPKKVGNSAPDAVDDNIEIEQGGVLFLDREMLLANDKDADGDKLTIEFFNQPKSGKLALDADNNLIYRPNEDFVGTDTFTYTVTDNNGASDTASVNVTIPSEININFDKIYYVNYAFNKADLTPASKTKVELIIEALKARPEVTVNVYAYTDSLGSNQYNLKLSNRRAKQTREWLIVNGIAPERVKAYGGGEDNAIADNATKEGQAINRRGEFHFNKP